MSPCPAPFEVLIVMMHEIDIDEFSRAIELAEGTDYSHTACRFVNEGGRQLLYHSASDGEVIEPFRAAAEGSEIKFAYRVPMAWSKEATLAYIRARSKGENGYSMRQIVLNQVPRVVGRFLARRLPAFIMRGLQKIFRRPIVRNGDAATICCEAMLMLLRGTNDWHRFQHLNQDKIALREFKELLDQVFERVPAEEIKYETQSQGHVA